MINLHAGALKPRARVPFAGVMSKLAALSALVLALSACGAAADGYTGEDVVAVEPAPAVLVGGFIDPAADWPTANDLTLTDGHTTWLVMFRAHRSGEEVIERINSYTAPGIEASLSEDGLLVLTTRETGPEAEITVLRGAALPKLGLVKGESVFGE